jgi:dUTP pyrophosphatase
MKVKIINQSSFDLPSYATEGAAGMDIRANLEEPMVLKPLERIAIPTGLSLKLPEGYEAQIRPRSGLALKYGITVLNAPGTIDSDYTGEIRILLVNYSTETFTIRPGERVAQMIISKYEKVEWEEAQTLIETERGEGGFGSTGLE